jgi:hypothetical protein
MSDNEDRELLEVDADFELPSAEGHAGYPEDLLELDVDELRRLAEGNGAPTSNGNGGTLTSTNGGAGGTGHEEPGGGA